MRKAWTQAIVALSLAGVAALVMVVTNALSDAKPKAKVETTKVTPKAKARITFEPMPKAKAKVDVKVKPKKPGNGVSEIPDKPRPDPKAGNGKALNKGKRLMYTTYFYTAGEAVVHGYSKGTKVRIVSLDKGGTIYKGVVNRGQTKLVRTGRGAFAFMSDKKATILVGTPSMCAVVGYWVRDKNGSFRSSHFFTQLPSSTPSSREKLLVWAYKDTRVRITDLTVKKEIFSGEIKAGGYHEIGVQQLRQMGSHVLEVKADKKAAGVQVYYDEGYFVPSDDGRASGKVFYSYVGDITNSANDLTLFAYSAPARVTVLDLKADKPLWSGALEPGKEHTLTLKNKYVKVTSDVEISVAVAPYKHYSGPYMEHHFAAGQEGTGIETEFSLTTPKELWIFSYFDRNAITVVNGNTGKEVWKGRLNAGQAAGIHPGQGFYRVKAAKGASVMGGALACGAEFSPAGSLFEVDEALLKVIMQIKEQRINRAAAMGRTLTDDEINAPLSAPELQQATRGVRSRVRRKSVSPAEAKERLDKMITY